MHPAVIEQRQRAAKEPARGVAHGDGHNGVRDKIRDDKEIDLPEHDE